jgi:hypothetical protein
MEKKSGNQKAEEDHCRTDAEPLMPAVVTELAYQHGRDGCGRQTK